jgi:hypothetical protein
MGGHLDPSFGKAGQSYLSIKYLKGHWTPVLEKLGMKSKVGMKKVQRGEKEGTKLVVS